MEQLHHQCPMCKGEFKPADGVSPQEHLAKGLLDAYRGLQEKNEDGNMLPCPRCGKPMNPDLENNAESRHEDVYICDDCGVDEAEREAGNDTLPVPEWYVVKEILNFQK